MNDPATEKQLAYINQLGGVAQRGISKQAASELIDSLLASAPAAEWQLKRLERLGAKIPDGITKLEADDLIEQCEDNQPPEQWQIDKIILLGGSPPSTRRDATFVIEKLKETAPAVDTQRQRISELGGSLPDGCIYQMADNFIWALERDADKKEGKPPTKTQLARIKKLGGQPDKAVNIWRADEYIEELEEREEDFDTRIEDALDWLFGDPDSRAMMPVRKPSKAIMRKALAHGDEQGWGEGWETKDGVTEIDLMAVAVYTVAPDLLKQNANPPCLPVQQTSQSLNDDFQPLSNDWEIVIPKRTSTTRSFTSSGHKPKGSGCLVTLTAMAGGLFLFLWIMFVIAMS